jgi:23S rRNA (guanosine2251-2'-O)-methyltransferase
MRHERRHEREKIYIYGKHALTEALLHAPQVIRKVFLSREASGDREFTALLSRNNISFELMKGKDAEHKVGEDTAHQGVIASADPSLLLREFKEFVRGLEPDESTMLVLLDELTDPHNVGAIIRSAAAFGAAGVLLPSHNQASITGAVVKTSVGMVFRVPVVQIGNVNYAIDALKEKGFKTYALAMEGAKDASKEKFDAPTLFVIGNEGRGIREKTLERADAVLRIPMHPRTESLNASVSAAIVLYEWSAAHPEALK